MGLCLLASTHLNPKGVCLCNLFAAEYQSYVSWISLLGTRFDCKYKPLYYSSPKVKQKTNKQNKTQISTTTKNKQKLNRKTKQNCTLVAGCCIVQAPFPSVNKQVQSTLYLFVYLFIQWFILRCSLFDQFGFIYLFDTTKREQTLKHDWLLYPAWDLGQMYGWSLNIMALWLEDYMPFDKYSYTRCVLDNPMT